MFTLKFKVSYKDEMQTIHYGVDEVSAACTIEQALSDYPFVTEMYTYCNGQLIQVYRKQ